MCNRQSKHPGILLNSASALEGVDRLFVSYMLKGEVYADIMDHRSRGKFKGPWLHIHWLATPMSQSQIFFSIYY